MHLLEREPAGRLIAYPLRGLPEPTRRHFCAAVCEATLGRVELAIPALIEALSEFRSGTVTAQRRAAVAAVVHELDVAAGDLADRDDAGYESAFRRARAAAAIEQALGTSGTAALETAYEAHHAGLALADILGLLERFASQS